MKQKDIFLESEGDAYWQRNSEASASRRLPEDDSVLLEILALPFLRPGSAILEIGCGDAARLEWLQEHRGYSCFGVDPSAWAVEAATRRGVGVRQSTADQLPFDDRTFDVVIFGWCLYLCDREDLFRIACEADRVLKNPGWLLIQDYYTPAPTKRAYHHRDGVFSYKMDYRRLFDWNPGYTTFSHKIVHFVEGTYSEEPEAWAATSVLRKNLELNTFYVPGPQPTPRPGGELSAVVCELR